MLTLPQLAIKIMAYIILIVSIVLALLLLGLIFFVSLANPNLNLFRLVLIDIGLVLLGFIVFIFGLGIFEFLLSFLKVEEEIEELEGDKRQRG